MSLALAELTDLLLAFRDARDWRRFHSLKNLILSVSIESAALLELTQWQDNADVEARIDDPECRTHLTEECADVLLYLLLIAERAGLDLEAAAMEKIEINERKYPVVRARGNAQRYLELRRIGRLFRTCAPQLQKDSHTSLTPLIARTRTPRPVATTLRRRQRPPNDAVRTEPIYGPLGARLRVSVIDRDQSTMWYTGAFSNVHAPESRSYWDIVKQCQFSSSSFMWSPR